MAVAVEAKKYEVDQEALIEAVATLDAFSSFFGTMAGGQDTPLGNAALEAAWRFADAAFGSDLPKLDPEGNRNPLNVAIESRSEEIVSELLAFAAKRHELHAEHARRIRAAGTLDVPSPFTGTLGATA